MAVAWRFRAGISLISSTTVDTTFVAVSICSEAAYGCLPLLLTNEFVVIMFSHRLRGLTDVTASQTLDVPTNWRRWSSWANGNKPETYEGHPIFAVEPMMTVMVTDRFDIIEMRGWLHENTRSCFQMWGRWDFTHHAFRVDRVLQGLVILFSDEDEAFFFKMRWG